MSTVFTWTCGPEIIAISCKYRHIIGPDDPVQQSKQDENPRTDMKNSLNPVLVHRPCQTHKKDVIARITKIEIQIMVNN